MDIYEKIKRGGDNAFERAMRMYGIKPKEAEKIFKSTDWANVDNGGGSGGGESASTIQYISVEGKDISEWGEVFAITTFLVKTQTQIVTTSFLIAGMGETVDGAIAFAIDPTAEIDFEGTRRTIADFLVNVAGVNLSTYNRITKEQFYDLNA